ncbi:MAG TPA: PqqD family protein [Solirubrobacterales bacterium]
MFNDVSSTVARTSEGQVVVPQHVVHRRFPTETVVLNLRTGKYHGLNPTAGLMLEELAGSGSIAATAARVAAEHGRDVGEVEADLRDLVAALRDRDLIEIQTGQE